MNEIPLLYSLHLLLSPLFLPTRSTTTTRRHRSLRHLPTHRHPTLQPRQNPPPGNIRLDTTECWVRGSFLLKLLLPRHPGQPVEEERGCDIEDDECPHDAKVAPAGRVRGGQHGKIGIRVRHGAELARTRGVGVVDVATCSVDVRLHVLATGLVAYGVETHELDARTGDVLVGEAGREHAVNEVGEGTDSVHEDPESWQCGGAGEDATKDQGKGEEELGDVAGCFGHAYARDNHVCKGGGEEQEGPDEEEHQRASFVGGVRRYGVAVHADRVVEAEEHNDSHDGIPWEFDENVGEHKDLPGIGLGGPFAGFVQ